MKRKWWVLFTAAIFAMLLSLCFFDVRLRIAPKWILSRAMEEAFEKLDQRFTDSPVILLTSAIGPQGRQRVSLQAETEQALLGIVRYDMELRTQLTPCRVQADGTVVTGGKALDLSVYMDGDFAAVSSKSLVEGSYYGITYDTFGEDIRGRQLLAALIGDKTIEKWIDSVSAMDHTLSREWKLPVIRAEDLTTVLYSILTLKPEVSRVATPAGADQYAHAVTFQISIQELAQIAEDYREELPREILEWLDRMKQDPEAIIEVEFLLHKGNLVQLRVETKAAQENTLVYVVLGDHPDTQQLTADITSKTAETYYRCWLGIDTASGEEAYQEKLHIIQTRDGLRKELSLDYGFDPDTGELDLAINADGDKAKLRMNLSGEGESLTIRSQNLRPLLNMLSQKEKETPIICTLVLSPGETVEVPAYSNLDQWSMDDLYGLLTGLGGFLGLKMP